MPRKATVEVEQEMILEPRKYTWVPLVLAAVTCVGLATGSIMGYATLKANVGHLETKVADNETNAKARTYETRASIKETKDTVKNIQSVQFQDGRDLTGLKATVAAMAKSIDKLVTAINEEKKRHGRYYRGPGPGTRRAP